MSESGETCSLDGRVREERVSSLDDSWPLMAAKLHLDNDSHTYADR